MGNQPPAKKPAPAEAGESSGHDAQTGKPETAEKPTADQCKAGWRTGLRWTREEFEGFCRRQLDTRK